MRKMLMLCALLLIALPQIAAADHIGVYSDASGSGCMIAPGISTTSAVVHKFSLGAVGSRFRVAFPPGTTVYAFNTWNAYPAVGDVQTGIGVAYGTCLQGSWAVGTFVADYAPGAVCMHSAIGFPTINYFDCNFDELPASGSGASVGSPCGAHNGGPACGPVAVESSTWGSVKSLYR